MADDERLMTKKEVQGYLKISHQTLFRWMRDGRLPFFKVDRTVRFRKSDIDALFVTKKK